METKNLLKSLKRRLGLITTALAMLLVSQGIWAASYTVYVYTTSPSLYMYTYGSMSLGDWPGKKINSTSFTSLGNNWYKCNTKATGTYTVMFNNNSGCQVEDLKNISSDAWITAKACNSDERYGSPTDYYLPGTFNSWSTTSTKCSSFDEGKQAFKYSTTLDAGDHEFRIYKGAWYGTGANSTRGNVTVTKSGDNLKFTLSAKSNVTIYYDCGNDVAFVDATPACTPPSITTHPSTTGATYCQNAAATALSVTASGTATLSYQWQKCSTQSGTYTDISGATNSSYTPVTTTAGTTYYKCKVTNDCGSATSNASGAIKVNAAPTITNSEGGTRCGTGTVNLNATASSGTVKWYAAATGGSSLGDGNSFTTPQIASTTTYYAEADDNGCVSTSRTAVVATVITRPAAPVSGGDISVCYGSDAEFKATQANSRCIDWYTASTGGEKLETCQTTYTKTNLTSDYTIYAEARIADNGCISASRTAIKATVKALNNVSNITFNPASIKKGDTTEATAAVTTVGGTGTWSTTTSSLISFSSDSSNPTTINANGIGTAEVTYTLTGGCSGTGAVNSKTVALVINSDCDVPSAGTISGDQAICAGSSVSLSVTGYTSTNTTLQWNKDGNPVAGKTSNTYTESNVTESATYTVTVTRTDVANCSATTTGYEVTVTPIPTITTHTDGSRCGAGTVTLSAAASAGDVKWYSASTGGTALKTGASYTTPSISTTTRYYVDATQNGCTTATRTAVTATVKAVPSIGSISAPANACGAGDITFTANGVTDGATVTWYENSSQLGTGESYTFSNVPAGTSHTVTAKATLNDCTSSEKNASAGRLANPTLTIGVTSSAITAGETDKTYGWEYATFTASSSTVGATVTGGITQTTEATVGKAGIIEGNKAKGHVGDEFTGSYTATGTNGCTTSDSKTVTVIKAEEDCNN